MNLLIFCGLQHHVPRSGRPWEDEGTHVSGPSACHLLATLWPLLFMDLVSLWGELFACHLCCRGHSVCHFSACPSDVSLSTLEALRLFCKMRSLVLNLSLLTAGNWVPGPLAGLGGSQPGGGWVSLWNDLPQLLLWSLLFGERSFLSSLDNSLSAVFLSYSVLCIKHLLFYP